MAEGAVRLPDAGRFTPLAAHSRSDMSCNESARSAYSLTERRSANARINEPPLSRSGSFNFTGSRANAPTAAITATAVMTNLFISVTFKIQQSLFRKIRNPASIRKKIEKKRRRHATLTAPATSYIPNRDPPGARTVRNTARENPGTACPRKHRSHGNPRRKRREAQLNGRNVILF